METTRQTLEAAAAKALSASESCPRDFVATCSDDELLELIATFAYAAGHKVAS